MALFFYACVFFTPTSTFIAFLRSFITFSRHRNPLWRRRNPDTRDVVIRPPLRPVKSCTEDTVQCCQYGTNAVIVRCDSVCVCLRVRIRIRCIRNGPVICLESRETAAWCPHVTAVSYSFAFPSAGQLVRQRPVTQTVVTIPFLW